MSLHKTRSLLYRFARLLGDVQAVASGSGSKMARRVGRRVVGRKVGRFLRKLFK